MAAGHQAPTGNETVELVRGGGAGFKKNAHYFHT